MNYPLIADYLWYIGHILSALSILFSHTNYYLAVALVLFGQSITIISRPLGRIKASLETKNDNIDENELNNKHETNDNIV